MLKIGLPIIVFYLIYIMIYLYRATPENASATVINATQMLEHVFMSLVILEGGAFAYDMLDKRDNN